MVYPKPTIQHCTIYKNYLECKKCEENYHLDANHKCVANKPIAECQIYATDTYETICLECNKDFY